MSDPFDRIERPELFLGFVAPIGADLKESTRAFRSYFQDIGYNVVEIKVTDVFRKLAVHLKPEIPLKQTPEEARLSSYIKYGNQIRIHFDDDQLLAALTIVRVIQERAS